MLLRLFIVTYMCTGTSIEVFTDFINDLCSDIENNGLHHHNFFDTDNKQYFLWDNLNSHLSPLITQLLEGWEGQCKFSSIARPPYQPKYGPTEYVICWIALWLAKMAQQNWTIATMGQTLQEEFANVPNLVTFFDHCGYSNDGNY